MVLCVYYYILLLTVVIRTSFLLLQVFVTLLKEFGWRLNESLFIIFKIIASIQAVVAHVQTHYIILGMPYFSIAN